MGQAREQDYDHHIDDQEHERDAEGDLVAVRDERQMETTRLYTAPGTQPQQQPYEQRRGYHLREMAEEPAYALTGEQRTHALHPRGRQEPREDDEHHLGHQQDKGYQA